MQNNSFLVAYNKAQKLTYHDLQINEDKTVNCIPIYEELIFTALFIDGLRVLTPQNEEQKKLFEIFSRQERYLIASEFFDANLINEKDYRKQNSEFCPKLVEPLPPVESQFIFNPVGLISDLNQFRVQSQKACNIQLQIGVNVGTPSEEWILLGYYDVEVKTFNDYNTLIVPTESLQYLQNDFNIIYEFMHDLGNRERELFYIYQNYRGAEYPII
jgi:hypothetical protein